MVSPSDRKTPIRMEDIVREIVIQTGEVVEWLDAVNKIIEVMRREGCWIVVQCDYIRTAAIRKEIISKERENIIIHTRRELRFGNGYRITFEKQGAPHSRFLAYDPSLDGVPVFREYIISTTYPK